MYGNKRVRAESPTNCLSRVDEQQISNATGQVSKALISNLVDKWTASATDAAQWQTLFQSSQEHVVDAYKFSARSYINSIALEKRLNVSSVALESASKQLEACAADAANSVADKLNFTFDTVVKQLQARVKEGDQLNAELVRYVSSFLAYVHKELEAHARRTLEAQLEVASEKVTVAHLKAAYSLEQQRHRRYLEEVNALMHIVELLAHKSKEKNDAVTQLARCREHVRLLEQQLSLNGIVAAILPEVFQPPPRRGRPAPPEHLRETAPQYFALRMLEHKDVTLSELVQSWCEQENRIAEERERCRSLRAASEQTERDALLVHQLYMEEKTRRERSDRRITEMVRERLTPKDDQSVANELSQLRWNYSLVMDDAAKLAVSLKLTKEELERTKSRVTHQEEVIKQLQTDAETDEVANTLSYLRRLYENNVRAMEQDFITTELNYHIVAEALNATQNNAKLADDSLREAKENAKELDTLLGQLQDDYLSLERKQSAERERMQELLDANERTFSGKIRELGAQLNVLDKEKSFTDQHDSALLDAFTDSLESLVETFRSIHPPLATYRKLDEEKQKSLDAMESLNRVECMRGTLSHLFSFIRAHLQTSDAQRANLLDASLSDAEYVTFLLERLKVVTTQRDTARDELKQSLELIQRHQLSVVEEVLQHDVSTDHYTSLEEITAQRDKLLQELAALQELQSKTTEYLEKKESSYNHVEQSLLSAKQRMSVLEEHTARLEKALEASFHRENDLLEKNTTLQGQLLALSSAHTEDEASETQPSSDEMGRFLGEFDQQLTTLGELLQNISTSRLKEGSASDALLSDHVLVEQLASSGLPEVIKVIREVFAKSDLLRFALSRRSVEQTLEIAGYAPREGQELATELAKEKKRALELERVVQQQAASQLEMGKRMAEVEERSNRADAANKKLLDMLKSVIEQKKALEEETHSLQRQLQEAAREGEGHEEQEEALPEHIEEAPLAPPPPPPLPQAEANEPAPDSEVPDAVPTEDEENNTEVPDASHENHKDEQEE